MKLRFPDAFFFVVKDMHHDWQRTALTVFGMAVVIFIYFVLSAFSQSLINFYQSPAISRNLIVIQSDLIDPGDAVLEKSAIQIVDQMPSELIGRASPVIFRHLRINDRVIQLRAARVQDWEPVFHMQMLEGRWPTGSDEVAAGEGAAKANDWKVGSIIKIFGKEFHITAIVRLPGSVFASVWMPIETAQELFGNQRGYQMMFVQVAPGADAEAVKSTLQKVLEPAGDYSVFFEDTYSRRNNQVLKDISSLMRISSSLALLAVSFGTYNATSLSLTERGREMGILRAIGFSHNTLIRLIGLRALLLGAGAFFPALVVSLGFIFFHRVLAHLYVLGLQITFEINWQIVAFGFITTMILAIVGAGISARRMLQMDVNSTLRNLV